MSDPSDTPNPWIDPAGETLASELSDTPARRFLSRNSGEILYGYRLEHRLGAGSMGEVFASRELRTGRKVALKLLSATTATRLVRFKREFRALAGVEHPNLVRLHELVVPESGAAFFTMELIDGENFATWVRADTPPGTSPPLERLLPALKQLVEGMHELHQRGYVHRDLKPANVLVARGGRVVILDFGLVHELEEGNPSLTHDEQVLGTPSFMAPEQTLGEPAGPAADRYALGVMLYQGLTGNLPHRGSVMQILLAKQTKAAPDPGDEVEGLPEGLRALCLRLLAPDPAARPSSHEIFASLKIPAPKERGARQPFVGRERELELLRAAHRRSTETRSPTLVELRGRSGHGKSALGRRFRAQLAETGAVVLHGRCGEHETVPYKGIDALVDCLSAYLRQLEADEREALRPRHFGALAQMFPVLDELWDASASSPVNYTLDEVRRLGARTLRELLAGIGARHPLLIHIDDFQWADSDSLRLLRSLLQPPSTLRALVLLAYRSEAIGSELLEALRTLELEEGSSTLIELEGLSSAESSELAAALLTALPGSELSAETIALRSQGSPLFILQTILGGRLEDVHGDELDELDELVASRLGSLAAAELALLTLLAVYGTPLAETLALELCPRASEATIRSLLEQRLLERDQGKLATAHDRVRELTLARLDPDERRTQHWQLGQRLRAELSSPYPEHLFAAVNHLSAGMGEVDVLTPELRLELAELLQRAGKQALASTAWIAARRYFDTSYELIGPWLERARRGEGPHELCVAVVFGLSRVESILESERGDALSAELLQWSLSTANYCEIAQWNCEHQFVKARFTEAVDFARPALARVGVELPPRLSWPRALFIYTRGWRKLWRVGLDQIEALPEAEEPLTRAKLELAALTSASAGFIDPKYQLAMIGRYAAMVTDHGLHDWAGVALAGLGMSALALGRLERSRALFELCEELANTRSTSAAADCMVQTMLMVTAPSLRPVDGVLERGFAAYARARDVGQRALVENIGLMCLLVSVMRGRSLPRVSAFLAELTYSSQGFMFAHTAEQVADIECWLAALQEGPQRLELVASPGPSLQDNQRSFFQIMRAMIAVLLGDHEGAGSVLDRLAADYPVGLELIWPSALYCLLHTLVDAQRVRKGEGTRALRRRLRRHRSQALKWAARCPANYQPMLEIIDAELAELAGDYSEALSGYERGRALANETQLTWISGLASERMAWLAHAHGHALIATAALEAALETYARWGASAVVRRLERDRSTLSGSALAKA